MDPTLSITSTGYVLTLDGLTYTMTWIGHILKVTGHGVCFYIYELGKEIMQTQCSLSALSTILAKVHKSIIL
jgi:hypothetical protein